MDPKAKELKKAKRYGRALNLIRQGVQLNQWSVMKVTPGDEVFIVGEPALVGEIFLLLHEVANEHNNKETVQAASSQLGASSEDDSSTSLPGETSKQEKTS
jgi:uncharacterized Zn finger protein